MERAAKKPKILIANVQKILTIKEILLTSSCYSTTVLIIGLITKKPNNQKAKIISQAISKLNPV